MYIKINLLAIKKTLSHIFTFQFHLIIMTIDIGKEEGEIIIP